MLSLRFNAFSTEIGFFILADSVKICHLFWQEILKSVIFFSPFVDLKDIVSQILQIWKTLSLRSNGFPMGIGFLFLPILWKSVICFDRFVNVKDSVTQNLLFWKTLSLRFNVFLMEIGYLFW
jgi:hypothetical protein